MWANILFSIAFFSACAAAILPGIPLKTRYICTLLLIFLSAVTFLSLRFQRKKPVLLLWISSRMAEIRYFFFSFFLFMLAFFVLYWTPEKGITVSYSPSLEPVSSGTMPSLESPSSKNERQIRIDLDSFDIQPTHLPFSFLSQAKGTITYSASFYLSKPLETILFFVSHGNADWTIDELHLARFNANELSRYQLIQHSLQPGIHSLRCTLHAASPIPWISVQSGMKEPLRGPFFDSSAPASVFFLRIQKTITYFFFLLAFFFLIPFLNNFLIWFHDFAYRNRAFFILLGFVAGITIFVLIRLQFAVHTNREYEADEAAFGLMSQRLLEGQSPPLFHYGQKYQGSLEAYPLALSMLYSKTVAAGLHMLPLIWCVGFLLITGITFWRFGNMYLALAACLCLGIGGLHFHWIFSKCWFGYSFSLLSGSILWAIALLGWSKLRLSPGWAALWGLTAGFSFYQLPLSLPFILFSGILNSLSFIRIVTSHYFSSLKQSSRRKLFVSSFLRSGLFISLLFFFLASFPYWGGFILQGDTGALQFIVKGRELAPPRIQQENPFVDRFLCECLPALLGMRAPYDHLNDLPSIYFPAFPPLLFVVSVILFPFYSKRSFSDFAIFSGFRIRTLVFLFALFVMLLVTLSPFGIWPWYAIPLYWVLPLFLFGFLRFAWSLSPSISAVAGFLFFLSALSAFKDYNPLFHQPSSLSYDGLRIPNHNLDIHALLNEKNIRFLLCDQGYDFSPGVAGRDWLGESLLLESNNTIPVDRRSRRAPECAQELLRSSRVGYLLHQDFYYNNPSPGENAQLYSPLSLGIFDTLFGPEYLDYERYVIAPYILYLPRPYRTVFDKSDYLLAASNPIYLLAAADHNLGFRGDGRNAYWSSDIIPEEGCFLRVTFPSPRPVQNLLLFHGSKISDRTRDNLVFIRQEDGILYNVGKLTYHPQILSSVLKLHNQIVTNEIEIRVSKPVEKNWWTIYEFWIY